MRIPGLKTAKTFSRWVQARVLGGAIILGYHSIATRKRDEYEICVTPEHFAEHMNVICKYAYPIHLSKLAQHLKDGTLPARSVAVTFDDGYADNLFKAKPVLEKYGVPATVFVCTGYAGREFWWDELERLILDSQMDPDTLRFETGIGSFEFTQPVMHLEERGGTSAREPLLGTLYSLLLSLDVQEREDVMNRVRRWAGLVSSDGFAHHHAMDHSELLQLAEGGLVELGAHTRTHAMLPELSLQRQREEIVSGKRDLESLLGAQVLGFSYPNGRATAEAKEIVREAGFAYACTSLHDTVRPGCDLHELTRFWQKDVDGDQFMKSLKSWTAM